MSLINGSSYIKQIMSHIFYRVVCLYYASVFFFLYIVCARYNIIKNLNNIAVDILL